jgi:CHAD domain-containing protein
MLAYANNFDSPQPYHSYHQLRKDAKKFRYALEFFTPILNPPNTEILVQNLVILQDHLGNLNDTVVATEIFEDFRPQLYSSLESDHPSIITYFESRKQERIQLTTSFAKTWAGFLDSTPQILLKQCLE